MGKYNPGDVLLLDDHRDCLIMVMDERPIRPEAVCVAHVIFGPRSHDTTFAIKEEEIVAIMTADEIEAFKILHS